MHKITLLVIALLLFSAGCVAMDESGIEGVIGVEVPFGPASLAGMWKGESNWDGTVKEIKVWVRKPIVERMITPTPQALIKSSETASQSATTDGSISPTGKASQSPAWEKVKDTGLVFWGWDIFVKGSGKEIFFNIQIIFVEDGQGKLTVVSQTGGTGNAIFVQDGGEKLIEVALAHPLFKEIKGRFIYEGEKINGSFTLIGKEGLVKLEKDNFNPIENQPQPKE